MRTLLTIAILATAVTASAQPRCVVPELDGWFCNPYDGKQYRVRVHDDGACLEAEAYGWVYNPYEDERIIALDVEELEREIADVREDVDTYLDRTPMHEVATATVRSMVRDVNEPLLRLSCIDKYAAMRAEARIAPWLAAVEREVHAEEQRRACESKRAAAKPNPKPIQCEAQS